VNSVKVVLLAISIVLIVAALTVCLDLARSPAGAPTGRGPEQISSVSDAETRELTTARATREGKAPAPVGERTGRLVARSTIGAGSPEPDDRNTSCANEQSAGFVFVEGRYVEFPYEVTSDKGWILINGLRAQKIANWPISVDSAKKPEIPEDLMRNAKSFDDLLIAGGKDAWDARMSRWIGRNFSDLDAQKAELKGFYESLPFVDQVTFPRKGTMSVALSNGEKILFGLDTPTPLTTKADALKRIEEAGARLEKRLAKGDTFLFFKNGLELSFGRAKGAKDLALMVEVLESERPRTQKIGILRRMAFIPEVEDRHISPLVTNFAHSEQLSARVQKLLKETGIKPRTLSEIPRLSPAQAERKRIRESMGDNRKQ